MINFLFSFKQVGGVPSLFFNLAFELQKKNVPFRLVSYRDSAIFSLFSKLKKPFIFLDYSDLSRKETQNKFNNNDVLIITWWDPILPAFKNVNPRILFWNVFPETLLYSNYIRNNMVVHYRNKRLLKIMLQSKGLVFMDESPLDWLVKYNGIEIKATDYLPIPVIVNEFHERSNKDDTALRITYIGRAEQWKLYPLLKIINDIEEVAMNLKISLVIITDNIQKVKSFLSENGKTDKTVNCQFYENISTEQLPDFLVLNSDINIAMGVSCLDSARVGVPSILVDPSKTVITSNYRYKWVYQTQGFNLGRFYNESETYSGYSLNEIINNIIQSENYLKNEGIRCYEYTSRFHNIKSITSSFINKVEESKLRVNDVLGNIYKYSMIYNLKNSLKKFLKAG